MSCTDGNCVYRTERGGMSTNGALPQKPPLPQKS